MTEDRVKEDWERLMKDPKVKHDIEVLEKSGPVLQTGKISPTTKEWKEITGKYPEEDLGEEIPTGIPELELVTTPQPEDRIEIRKTTSGMEAVHFNNGIEVKRWNV